MDTGQKYNENKKQLIYATQRLNESQELSRIGSWDWNVVTNEIIWSDMMFKLLGLLPMEAEPSYELVLHHVHIKDKERYQRVLAKALDDKSDYYLENLITYKDQTTLSVISRGKCILDDEGNLLRMIGTVQDVTHQTYLKKKAQNGERLKTAFLENISHELRTPLNAILGFSELIINKNLSDEKKEKYIEQVDKSGKRLLNFLTDITEISKIESQNNQLFFQNYNLNNLINDLLLEFQKANKNNKVQLINHKAINDDESFIKTDVAKLKLILSKLIHNALKYTNSGIIEFGYVLEAGFIKFNAKDTGKGISKKIQKNLFQRFRQFRDPKIEHYEGAGLGLPIAKGMVDLFGGEIWLESEMKKGTNFFFTIPYIKGEDNRKQLKNKLNKPGKKTILIAEDDIANYKLFTILMNDRFNILHAENGKEAVRIFSEHASTIDLILMDIRMPQMNGFDASKEIRKMSKAKPIIAHTAYAMEHLMEQMEEAGINDLLNKPAELEDIEKIFKKYVY